MRVFDSRAEVDSPDPRPVDSREAHRTRLRRAVYLRALQRMGSELAARLADCEYLGMCRRITSSDYGVPFRSQNLSIAHEASPKRSPQSALNRHAGSLNGRPHEL